MEKESLGRVRSLVNNIEHDLEVFKSMIDEIDQGLDIETNEYNLRVNLILLHNQVTALCDKCGVDL